MPKTGEWPNIKTYLIPESERCEGCHGSGKVYPYSVFRANPCPACNGTGWKFGEILEQMVKAIEEE